MTKLSSVPGERWWRDIPTREAWGTDGGMAAPGVFIRSARYWLERTLPDDTWAGAIRRPIERLDPTDLPIAVRRWLATRFAWRARTYVRVGRPTFEGLLATLSLSRDDLSADAVIAVRGIFRESTLDEGSSPVVPGFGGPDAWYAE